jgi:hypothetical protein
MNKCGYCGKENDDALTACTGCGTPFVEPPLNLDQRASIPIGGGMLLQTMGAHLFDASKIAYPGYRGLVSCLGFVLLATGTVLLVRGSVRYAQAKGYPQAVGFLGLCTCLGVLVLFLLPRRAVKAAEQTPGNTADQNPDAQG